jgi:DNA-binding transcriptional LysR family regulator
MIYWDDVRYFLAIARAGSVRSAAGRVKVNHSTVLRRTTQPEERLGAHLSGRLPSGYRRGALRVTLPPLFAGHSLVSDFADFARERPEFQIEMLSVNAPEPTLSTKLNSIGRSFMQ